MDKELLLCELLKCGTADLVIINDCEYDISDVLEVADMFGNETRIDLGAIAYAISHIAYGEIEIAINETLEKLNSELEELLEESEENQDSAKIENLRVVVAELESLNPYDDFDLFFNYLDTHVSCVEHKEVYERFLTNEIDTISETSGLTFYIN